MTKEARSEMRKKCFYRAASLKNRDDNQVNATNRLRMARCVKTERSEREVAEEIVVAGHVGGRKKVEGRIDGFNDAV